MNLPSALTSAFTTGSTREFHRCVSALGVPAAAKILGTFLGNRAEGVEGPLRSNRHLFAPSARRGIPGADEFLRLMLRSVTDSSTETTEARKLKILQALGSNLQARDLADLSVVTWGHQGARYIASTVCDLGGGLEWAKAAVKFLDGDLLAKFGPRLSSDERLELWIQVSYTHGLDHLECLANYGPPLDTDDHMQLVFNEMAYVDGGQAARVALLLQARPLAAANYRVPLPPSRGCYWLGKTLRLLLEAGAALDREDWIHVFRWQCSSTLVAQIDEVSPLIDLNLRNGAKFLLLEEVYLMLIDTHPALRLPVLAKFLEVGADPTPLLKPVWQRKLAPAEKALLAPAAANWLAKLRALEEPSVPLPVTVVGLDLI